MRDTRAREEQADKFFKECIEIADAATQENCNVARLRVDTRKWAAARLAPKKYGDHVQHEHKGGINFQPQILIQCSSDDDVKGVVALGPRAVNNPFALTH